MAFRLYFPEISSDKSLKKEERLSVFDRMTPENARFTSQDIKFYFYIGKEALKKFPKRYFEPGARMAATLSFELKAQERQGPLTIHGALLMEVVGTYATKEEFQLVQKGSSAGRKQCTEANRSAAGSSLLRAPCLFK